MSQSFSIKLNSDPAAVFAKFQATAAKNDVSCSGNQNAGQFSGSGIQGSYSLVGNELTVTIDKKPMLIPWSVVESKVRAFFA